VIDDGLWRSGRTGMPSGPGVAQALGVGSACQGEKTSLANEEAIRHKVA
jgi:hypothetical protein